MLSRAVVSPDSSSSQGTVQSIAVVGAGQMGSGIAYMAAASGYQVRVVDVKPSQLNSSEQYIKKLFQKQIDKGKITLEEGARGLGSVSFSGSLADCSQADVVIEAVVENLDVKRGVLADICSCLKADGLIASNTSSLSLTKLAAATNRPHKVIGMHFMNPVPVMELVEVIQGLTTSLDTFTTVAEIITRMGKTMVVSKDTPGFIVNRLLMPMINEAVFALYEGVATVHDIDTAMTLGTNQPMGPLALADLIGLDTCLSIMAILHAGFGDSKYRPCPLLTTYVDAGWLGRKTGKGFYAYYS